MILRYKLLILALATTIAQAQNPTVNITYPSNTPPGAYYVSDNFFGISFEMQVINTIIGNTPQTIPTPVIQYIANIRQRVTQPLRLRVGGNSMDNSYYIPTQVPMIQGNVNNTSYSPINYGPILLNTIAQLSDSVGGAIWNVGLGLIHMDQANNTVILALNATSILGNRLDSFMLGNEPDLYLGPNNFRTGAYTEQNYIDDYANILGQMHAQPELVNAPMAGPTICCGAWDLNTVLTGGWLGAFKPFLKYVTVQHYPQTNCFPMGTFDPLAYLLNNYLNHPAVVTLGSWSANGIQTAIQSGVNVSMAEFNTVSCGGIVGVSDTFGAAMWTIDYVLQLASVGYQAAYIHTRELGISYNIFQPPAPTVDQNSSGWTTGPPYHSLLVIAEVLHANYSSTMSVVDLNLPSSPTIPVAGYAIYPAPTDAIARMPPTRFVLINYAQSGAIDFQLNQNVTGIDPLTGGTMTIGSVVVKYLTAATVTANVNITWGGQVVDGGGNLQGAEGNTTVANCGQTAGCAITVPGPGIAVVFLDTANSGSSIAPLGNATAADGLGATPSPTYSRSNPNDPGYLLPSRASRAEVVDVRILLTVLLSLIACMTPFILL